MARNCERCRVLERQKYWEELDKNKSIFIVMMNDFRHRLLLMSGYLTKVLVKKGKPFFVKINMSPFCKHPDEVADEHTSDQQRSEDEPSYEEKSCGSAAAADTDEEDNAQEPTKRKSSHGKHY
ncbi:hypothetical protein T459_06660 [Capsicum annuum]|uniref:Uncharacterized protein n=1 Tax=Capsicum annuum TaxID=4072 RepID=A0A2G3ABD2_CAPAN|nr:hypothetical protein T459_06660 [Capsicum annuum]